MRHIFDFIPFKADMLERDIENAMVAEVTKLLLELGAGFAFLGNQYHLNVGGEDFYLDLLFYNLKLRCYVVIELKTGDFKPEYAGNLHSCPIHRLFFLSIFAGFVIEYTLAPFLVANISIRKGTINGKRTFAS